MKYVCPKCQNNLNEYEVEKLWCTSCNAKFKSIVDIRVGSEEELKQQIDLYRASNPLILSTTSFLEGYIIERYIEVLSEDVVFKPSKLKALGNRISNFFDDLSFFEAEVTGSTNVIIVAKEHIKEKLIRKATKMGANAIVGINFESSFTSTDIAKVSMSGTAVFVKKI